MAWWHRRDRAVPTGSEATDSAPACSCCTGGPDPADPRFNLSLPDPVADLLERGQQDAIRFASDLMVATSTIGAFTRALLPVRLTDGRTVTFGVWVSIDRDTYARVSELGRDGTDEEYRTMRFDGLLASSPEPWGRRILRAEVSAGIPADSPYDRPVPYLTATTHRTVTRIMNEAWAPAEVLTGSRAWALHYDPDALRTRTTTEAHGGYIRRALPADTVR
ncbi:DUF2199 domain-containing protein [Kitasatospora sp. NPDC059571]|uniref:DUF2199 domain-containing protein n=1 Tax=Kitasatospora sp. NPDC059571 TaxID=3346871 RepID=UPI0036C0951E